MATETKTFYPQAHEGAINCKVGDASKAIGKSSASTTGYSYILVSDSNEGYCFWPFNVSSIPQNAEINSVTCKARGLVAGSGGSATFQLYSGTTAKGSPSGVSSESTNGSVSTLSVGTWTREELSSVRLRTYASASSRDNKLLALFGADLTVEYTYRNDKFMLKSDGAWHNVARVFKKVNGIWVEQTDLRNVVKEGIRYQNGQKIANILPFGYTRLNYIQSSGTQYIDTGYKATSENYQIKCKFATTNDEINTVIFGGGASTDTISALLQSTNQIRFYVGSGYVSNTTATFTRGAECELECHANTGAFTVNLNGVAYTGSYSETINKDWPLFIFANNVSGTASQFSSIRLYAFQIYDNGNMVRNLIPCVNANNVAGMYDMVNGVFYPSNSDAQFVAGPQISSGTTEPTTHTVTITGIGHPQNLYVTVNDIGYYTSATVQAETGTIITTTINSKGSLGTGVAVDDSIVSTQLGNYNYTVTDDCEVVLDYSTSYHTISIITNSSDEANLITFTIDNTNYQAEEGMTWEEWVESSYDIENKWYIDSNYVLCNGPYSGTYYIVCEGNSDIPVSPDTVIPNNGIYTTEFG